MAVLYIVFFMFILADVYPTGRMEFLLDIKVAPFTGKQTTAAYFNLC